MPSYMVPAKWTGEYVTWDPAKTRLASAATPGEGLEVWGVVVGPGNGSFTKPKITKQYIGYAQYWVSRRDIRAGSYHAWLAESVGVTGYIQSHAELSFPHIPGSESPEAHCRISINHSVSAKHPTAGGLGWLAGTDKKLYKHTGAVGNNAETKETVNVWSYEESELNINNMVRESDLLISMHVWFDFYFVGKSNCWIGEAYLAPEWRLYFRFPIQVDVNFWA